MSPQKLFYFGVGTCALAVMAAFGQTAPRFQSIQALTNREIRLQLDGSQGSNYKIDVSSNFASWSPLVTLTGVTTSLQHTDSAAPYFTPRFYRAEQVSGTNVLTGDHLVTTNGNVLIRPVGHASFVLSWQGKMIYNDPTNGSSPYAGFPKADLILVSHTHGDHFSSSTIDAVRSPNAVIVAPLAVYSGLSVAQKAIAVVLTNGASANVMGLNVEAVPAYNSNHPQGVGNGYILTIAGQRLYISGDTGNIPEMRQLLGIDVAFVCMNVPFTMSVADAATAVRAFRPRIVYPYHYRNGGNPVTYADLLEFKRQIGQDLAIEVRFRKWY